MLTPPITRYRSAGLVSDPPPVSPQDLGLSEKFQDWRRDQWSAVDRIVNSSKRFHVLCAPTGMGKTIIGMAAALLTGRTVVLTATKGLQDQLEEFRSMSSDIRGLANYLCPITESLGIPKYTTVADAPCQCGYGCALRKSGCTFYDSYRAAQNASIVVTNFQMWMYDKLKSDGQNSTGDIQYGYLPNGLDIEEEYALRDKQKVRLLIADEVHDAENQLCMFLGVDFSRRECLAMRLDWPDSGLSVDDWQYWAKGWLPKVGQRLVVAEQKLKVGGGNSWSKEIKHLRDIKRKLDRLSEMQAEDGWIMNEAEVDGKSMAGVRFDPLSPARYAEEVLWRNVEKVVLVSATVRPKTAELLGIKNEDLEFCEYGSSFDPKRRPVVYIPSTRMTYHTEQDDGKMKWWLAKLDTVIEPRLHHKGLIHAVSYKRAKFIKDNSEFGGHMLIHNSHDRANVVEQFKLADAPCILVSPSVGTGYDFAGDLCRWQIVAKLPFASVQDKVIKARQEKDKEYGMYLTAQDLVQTSGRPVRSQSDWAETLIMDGNFEWFYGRARRYIPLWFQEAVVWWDGTGVPEPLEFTDKCDQNHKPENNSSTTVDFA